MTAVVLFVVDNEIRNKMLLDVNNSNKYEICIDDHSEKKEK